MKTMKTMRDENDETAKVKKTEGKTMRDETTEHEVMNGATTTPAPAVSAPPAPAAKRSDGFDDDDGVGMSIIRGEKLKFTNAGTWVDENGDPIAKDREFLVVEVMKVRQKWIDGKPVETHILGSGEYFPDIEKLNAEAPRSEWREVFGKMAGPWQNSFVLYLLDPKPMRGFTFPTSTAGGFRAVFELKGDVHRARMLQGDNVYPVVTLADTHMKTQYGGRQRPAFKIVRFVQIGGKARPLLEQPELEPMNDAIGL
jgi:hypothetical protein